MNDIWLVEVLHIDTRDEFSRLVSQDVDLAEWVANHFAGDTDIAEIEELPSGVDSVRQWGVKGKFEDNDYHVTAFLLPVDLTA